MSPDHRTEQLLANACEIGFDPVGVCRAEPAVTFPDFVDWLEETLRYGTCCGMTWLVRHRDARRHPEAVLPEVKSLIVVGLPYTAVTPTVNLSKACPDGFGLVAEYARGLDYHDVMRAKLRQLAEGHRALFPDEKTRIAVDTAPILEREYAARVGLGQPGKNTMLINDRHGSRFFIGLLLSTAELCESFKTAAGNVSDRLIENVTVFNRSLTFPAAVSCSPCGDCRRCIDACPTGALATPFRLDAGKCINYWSIEHPGNDIPREIAAKFGNRLFGCETCQSVCPFNKPVKVASSKPIAISRDELVLRNLREQLEIGMMSLSQIESLDEHEFQHQFAGTPFMRLGLPRLTRNAAIVRENKSLRENSSRERK